METFFKINDMTLADVDNCAVLEEKIFEKSEFNMLFSIEYLIIIMYHF